MLKINKYERKLQSPEICHSRLYIFLFLCERCATCQRMGPVRLRIVAAQLETVAEPRAHFVICKQLKQTSAFALHRLP